MRQILWPHAAGRRPRAGIAELVALGPVSDKVNASGRARIIKRYPFGAHAFLVPQLHQPLTEGVSPQTGDVSGRCALSGCGNDGIAGVTPKTLQVHRWLRLDLIEFDQSLAQSHDIEFAV